MSREELIKLVKEFHKGNNIDQKKEISGYTAAARIVLFVEWMEERKAKKITEIKGVVPKMENPPQPPIHTAGETWQDIFNAQRD